MPSDDRAGKHVDHKRDVHETPPGRDVAEVRHPRLIRPSRGEVSIGQIARRIAPCWRASTAAADRGFRLAFEVRRRGDRQHTADRLDPKLLTMIVDERDHHLAQRSSSA